jgi:hypothetical protein
MFRSFLDHGLRSLFLVNVLSVLCGISRCMFSLPGDGADLFISLYVKACYLDYLVCYDDHEKWCGGNDRNRLERVNNC